MNPLMFLLAALLTAYLIGSIPFGVLVARWRGVDIFAHGSGNIGATNVGRILGRGYGLFVFVLDFAKGAGPVAGTLMVRQSQFFQEAWLRLGWLEVGAGLAAFLGHLFPIYLRFRGGKGVATGAGVVAVLVPIPTLAALFTWMVLVLGTRLVSLASVLAAFVLCFAQFLGQAEARDPRTWFCVLAAFMVFVRHRPNLARLLKGTENRLKETPTMHQLSKTVHVLALGLWFGSSVFFTFPVTLSLFDSFEKLGQAEDRPGWFPRPEAFAVVDDHINGPREQGSRAAGFAVGPLFDIFFLLQGVCGFLAVGACLPWSKANPHEKSHRLRTYVLIVALATVLVGWPLEKKVHHLRLPRNLATEAYLEASAKLKKDQSRQQEILVQKLREEMSTARGEFLRIHTYSFLLNFATVILVAWGMALAARLPDFSGVVEPRISTPSPNS